MKASIILLLFFAILIIVAISIILIGNFSIFILFIFGLITLVIVFKYPEIALVLFVISGQFYLFEIAPFLLKVLPPKLLLAAPIVLLVALFSFLIKSVIYNPKSKVLISKSIFVIPAFSFVLCFGCFYTSAPFELALNKALEFTIFMQFALFAPIFLVSTIDRYKRILWSLFFIIIALAISGLFLDPLSTMSEGRRLASIGGPTLMSRLFGYGMIIAITFFLTAKRFSMKIFMFISIVMLLFTEFLTASRAGALGIVIFLLLYSLLIFKYFPKTNIQKRYMALLICLSAIIVLLIYSNRENFEISFKKHIERFSLGEEAGAHSISRRLDYFESARYPVAKKMFLKSPFFGTGTGSWGSEFGDIYHGAFKQEFFHGLLQEDIMMQALSYPHSIFLEILGENGLIGFLLFLAFLVSVFRNIIILIKLKTNNQDTKLLSMATVGCLIFAFSAGILSSALISVRFIFFFSGLVYALKNILMLEKEKGEIGATLQV